MGTWIAEQITCKLIASSVIEEGDGELYCYGFFLLITRFFFSLLRQLLVSWLVYYSRVLCFMVCLCSYALMPEVYTQKQKDNVPC